MAVQARLVVWIVLVFVVCLVAVPGVRAANFTVNDAASLIAAINTANSNGEADVITLAGDIILTDIDNTTEGVNGLPSILADGGNSLTFEGNGFTLSRGGTAAFRMMHISAGANVFINDLTIENGLANIGGFGVMGGAIFSRGQLSIDNSIFRANTASNGTSNGFGGAIEIITNTLTVTNSSFIANTAPFNTGGAIHNTRGNVLLVGNTFSNNTALGGGAVATEGGNLTLINNTISGNTASSDGGGISTGFNSMANLQNNTITNNTAATGGGGIYNFIGSVVNLHNNIIAGNSAATNSQCFNNTTFGPATLNANSYNVLGSGGDAGGCPAGATDIVPAGAVGTIIGPLANNNGPTFTHALVIGSPALDAANLANCPSADQRGFLRGFNGVGAVNNPQVGDCDIGAFEFSLTPIYDSNPAVGSTLNLGSTFVGTQMSTVLEIIEAGAAALAVSLDSITGANAGDFTIIGLPTAIGDGNPPQEIAIICSPSAAGLRTAQVTFTTNDPTQPAVSYDVECTGIDTIVASASILGINQIVAEGNTAVTATVQLDVPAGFTDTGNVTVQVMDAGVGNAVVGADYAVFPPTTVTFPGPLTAGATYTQTVTVNLLDDTALEGAEALALSLGTITGAAEVGQPDSHTIVINDNDANLYAEASFIANSAIIDEDAGTLSIDVQLRIPAGFSLPGNISLTISDSLAGNATSGGDYTVFAPATLTFNAPFTPGSTLTQTVTLDILDDAAAEGAETVELGITGVSGPVALVSPAAFTAIINDDEVATVIVPGGQTVVTVPGSSAQGDTDYLSKTVDKPLATVGETVTYTILAHNPKTIPLTQVTVYDVFDERLTDIRLISTTHGRGFFNGRTLIVNGFTLHPGEEATIVVSARVAALRSGDVIPNAAVLESPDASVHVSNLALVGDSVQGNNGGASNVLVIPPSLPATGETPYSRNWVIGGVGLLTVLSVALLVSGRRRNRGLTVKQVPPEA